MVLGYNSLDTTGFIPGREKKTQTIDHLKYLYVIFVKFHFDIYRGWYRLYKVLQQSWRTNWLEI